MPANPNMKTIARRAKRTMIMVSITDCEEMSRDQEKKWFVLRKICDSFESWVLGVGFYMLRTLYQRPTPRLKGRRISD